LAIRFIIAKMSHKSLTKRVRSPDQPPVNGLQIHRSLLLAAFGVSLIVADLFKTDRVGLEATGSGNIHAAATTIGLTAAIIAMAQWIRWMETDSQLTGYMRVLAKLTFLSAVLFVHFLLSGGLAARLVQRVFLSTILGWLLHATRVVLVGPLTAVPP
jgi:uncharacterized membrane protein YidH (DUF202 family)